jgi:hypothetical protein
MYHQWTDTSTARCRGHGNAIGKLGRLALQKTSGNSAKNKKLILRKII